MTKNFEDNRDLARLTQLLPARGQIGLTAVLAYLALNHLRGMPDYPLAQHAFELTRRWFDGERFNPDRFEDALQDEDNEGIGKFEHVAPTKEARAAWTLLGDAVAYTAFLAYQTTGQHPSPGICDVDESCLDDFDRSIRAVSPQFVNVIAEAAEYLREEPEASFVQLKTKLSREFGEVMGEQDRGPSKSTGAI